MENIVERVALMNELVWFLCDLDEDLKRSQLCRFGPYSVQDKAFYCIDQPMKNYTPALQKAVDKKIEDLLSMLLERGYRYDGEYPVRIDDA
jgi:hypothetical protein